MTKCSPRQTPGLLERLASGPIICAEGYLFELERRGYLQAGAFVPEVVLDRPEEVKQLHREFVHAGSDVVEAFTYYAHREKLRIIGKEELLEPLNRQALAIDPSLAAARNDLAAMHYNVGMSLLDQRHTEEAVRYLRQAAELSPEVALYHYNLGVATFMAGRPADALPDIREAIRLNPDDPDAHGFLAVVLRELGDTPGAQERRSGR